MIANNPSSLISPAAPAATTALIRVDTCDTRRSMNPHP